MLVHEGEVLRRSVHQFERVNVFFPDVQQFMFCHFVSEDI